MKNRLPLIGFLCLAVVFSGCASMHFSGDPTVIVAETTTQTSMDIFDTYLQFEYSNRTYLQKTVPSAYPAIHTAAERIRRYGIGWLQSARNLTMAYKHNRTPENKVALTTAIATIQQAATEAENWMNQLSAAAPVPTPPPALRRLK